MIEPAMNYNFDSHKYVKALQAKGFKEEQAEVLIDAILKSKEYDLSNLATKDQFALAVERLEAKIDKLDAKVDGVEMRLEAKIDGLEARLDAKIDKLDAKVDGVEMRLEAKIDGLEDRLDAKIDKLDTKVDGVEMRLDAKIDSLGTRLDARITEESSKLMNEISKSRAETSRWMMSMFLAVTGMFIAIAFKLYAN